MAEILHQLIDSLSHHLQGFIHPRWCRISSINSSNNYSWFPLRHGLPWRFFSNPFPTSKVMCRSWEEKCNVRAIFVRRNIRQQDGKHRSFTARKMQRKKVQKLETSFEQWKTPGCLGFVDVCRGLYQQCNSFHEYSGRKSKTQLCGDYNQATIRIPTKQPV